MLCKKCGTELNKDGNLCDKCKKKTSKKQKLAIAMLIISFLFLYFNTPSPSDEPGFFIGVMIRIIATWTALLGCIAYLIWRFIFKKQKGLFLFIFAVIFFSAVIFEFVGDVFRGYVMSDINTPEFREKLEKSMQESKVMRDELNRRGLMSELEKQEGKSFEKIPDNIIKDFLNENLNN